MKKKLAELQAARAKALDAWKKIVADAEQAGRDLTDEEETRSGELRAEVSSLDAKIERRKALDEAERSAPAIHQTRGDDWERDSHQFRIVTAMRHQLGERVDAAREIELSAELQRRTQRQFAGIAVPDRALLPLGAETRVVTSDNQGAALIPLNHRPDLYIDRLRPARVVEALGATVLSDLAPGPLDIPRQVASGQTQWLAEDAAVDETDPEWDSVTLEPRTVASLYALSRRTLLHSSPSVENLVRADLSMQLAQAVDVAALFGAGDGTTPAGITTLSGAYEQTMASGPSWAAVLAMIAAVQAAGALSGRLGWAISPWAIQRLRSVQRFEEGDTAIMEGADALAGYPVQASANLHGDPANSPAAPTSLIFADWSQCLIGVWPGADILVNPFAAGYYEKGRLQVRAMRDCDVAFRHEPAFAFCTDLPVTVES